MEYRQPDSLEKAQVMIPSVTSVQGSWAVLEICGGMVSPEYLLPFDPFYFLLWLRWVFVATCRLSLVAVSGGYSLVGVCRLLVAVACRCRVQALEREHMGLAALRQVESFQTGDRTCVPCIGQPGKSLSDRTERKSKMATSHITDKWERRILTIFVVSQALWCGFMNFISWLGAGSYMVLIFILLFWSWNLSGIA